MKANGKVPILLLALMLVSCSAYRPNSRQQQQNQQGNVSMQIFYDQLDPYGHWVHNRQFGYVWIPHVGRNFYPYATNGQWVMTDYGWTWVSGYEWGWAPFHYGRWDYDNNYGWFWFPGDEWAPAWVTWRSGEGFYGWAPMRPDDYIGMGSRDRYADDIHQWVFVRQRDFGKPNGDRYYLSNRRNDEIFRTTSVIGNTRTDNQRRTVYEAGPDASEVERTTGRRVVRVPVMDSDRPGRRLSNNQLEIYRPSIQARTDGNRPTPPRISDIKDVRPMRERDRTYQPENDIQLGENPQNPVRGQGQREFDQNQQEREVRRQYEEKQAEREKRQDELELQRRSREAKSDQDIRREQLQTREERLKRTDQQKKNMQKERDRSVSDAEVTDSSRIKRVESERVRNTRRK